MTCSWCDSQLIYKKLKNEGWMSIILYEYSVEPEYFCGPYCLKNFLAQYYTLFNGVT